MESPTLLVERDEHVLVLTMNRPHVRNAIDAALADAVADAVEQLDADPDLRVGVLTGVGGTFSAGLDLKAFARGESVHRGGRGLAGLTERPPAKPLIAAVEGFALGGGFEIVLACDLVVASTTAVFALPEVTRGLTAASGGLLRLPQRLPYYVAMELILTGRRMEADEAARYGLVNRLVAPGAALASALELAKTVADNAPLAVVASKRVVSEARDWPTQHMFAIQHGIVDPIRQSEDAKEGARSFIERRAPRWQGR